MHTKDVYSGDLTTRYTAPECIRNLHGHASVDHATLAGIES